jgi:transposase
MRAIGGKSAASTSHCRTGCSLWETGPGSQGARLDSGYPPGLDRPFLAQLEALACAAGSCGGVPQRTPAKEPGRASTRGVSLLPPRAQLLEPRRQQRLQVVQISGAQPCPLHSKVHVFDRPRAGRNHTSTRSLLGQEVDVLEPLQLQAKEWLVTEAKAHRICRILATAPGMGRTRTAQLVAVVGTPHRFRTRRQFWSYCGLAVVTRSISTTSA